MRRPAVLAMAMVLVSTGRADLSYMWDTVLITTSTPPGTGAAMWRSPEPIVTNADGYVCTSALHAVGYLLQFPTVIDVGIVTYATNSGPVTDFPLVFFDHTLTQAITQPLSAWYTLRLLATLQTDSHVHIQLSQYQSYGGSPPNTSTPLPSRLEMRGFVTNGLGTAVTAVPETSALAALLPALLCWHHHRAPARTA